MSCYHLVDRVTLKAELQCLCRTYNLIFVCIKVVVFFSMSKRKNIFLVWYILMIFSFWVWIKLFESTQLLSFLSRLQGAVWVERLKVDFVIFGDIRLNIVLAHSYILASLHFYDCPMHLDSLVFSPCKMSTFWWSSSLVFHPLNLLYFHYINR